MIAERALDFHEVANIFPMMGADEFRALVDDIRANGLRTPIWTHEGKIIDGRNRYKACLEAGVKPRFEQWDQQGSLVTFVVSLNLNRRHLTSSQKAMVALEVERHLSNEAKQRQIESGKAYGKGMNGPEKPKVVEIFQQPMKSRASEQAAKITNTNHHYVVDAKKIVEQAPELKAAVMSGALNIPDAKKIAKLPEPQRAVVLQRVATGEVKKPQAAILDLRKAEVEAQAQAAPTKPRITLASWEDWLPQQEKCDLLITDPPYATDVHNIEAFANAWLPLALSKVKFTGRAYVCIGAYPHELNAYLSVKTPIQISQVLVWSYRNTLGPSPDRDYKQSWQAILYYRGSMAPKLNCGIMTEQFSAQRYDADEIDAYMEINAPDGRLGNRYHAWQKPIELAERLIRHSTKPGDTVMDCFSGTGTFMLAAHRLGRVARGCDRSPEMLRIAETRGCEIDYEG